MEIRDILIKLRKDNNMTQKHVADLLSMSATGYASWEQGLAEPSITAIKLLCKIYNITADYLLGLED